MMSGLRFMVDGDRMLPFVRAFYGQPSSYSWEDEVGEVHSIPQSEGGEQGDPLMPLLFCLGQHLALSAVVAGLREGERLFAYLDDLYVVCKPDRVGAVHDLLRVHLWDKCRISLHAGKTKVWNKSGTYSPDCARLQRAATDVFLEEKIADHSVLLARIPAIPDTQSAWLLLSFCAAARFNFILRTVNLSETDEFAAAHDRGVWLCLCKILSILPSCGAGDQARLPLWEGGLGAHNERNPPHIGQDATKMVKDRHQSVAVHWREVLM